MVPEDKIISRTIVNKFYIDCILHAQTNLVEFASIINRYLTIKEQNKIFGPEDCIDLQTRLSFIFKQPIKISL